MSKTGIWVSPTQFVDFSDSNTLDKSALTEDIASRQAAWDWTGFMGLLPDPDPILRKLGNGAEILESLTADGHLCSVIQSRQLGTLKKEFNWQPGTIGEEKPSRQAKRLSDQLAGDLERVDMYNLVAGILNAPLYGMTPIEIKWKPGDDRIKIIDLEAKPARWFGYNDKNEPRFVSTSNMWDGQELPFGKFVIARHFPTYDNPYGLRLLSRCFWPVAFKKGGIKFWVNLAEKYGMPFLLGTYRPGAGKPEQQEMLSKLVAMVKDACAVIPQGGTVQILESGKGSSTAEIHSGLKSAMDSEMSKVIMLQTLTAEVSDKGGSRAQGQVHQDILELAQDADSTLVKRTMEEIAWLYGQVNAPGVPTPKFCWFEEDDPQIETAERDKTLKETGVKFTKSYYIRKYRLQEDDFDLEAPNDKTNPPNPPYQGGTRAPSLDKWRAGEGLDFATATDLYPDQTALDSSIAAISPEDMQKTMDTVLRPVIVALQQTGNIDEAMNALVEAYPKMDTAALQEMLTRMIFVADCWGKLNA